MNLENFEEHIDDKIVDRGYAYYLDDFVTLEGASDFTYRFRVVGSDLYKVVVMLNEAGDIVSSTCNCPYAYGPICKHEVAVYFELHDGFDDESGEYSGLAEVQQDLTAVLNDLSKDQLVQIVEEVASEDSILKSRLLLHYSKMATGQELVRFKSLVRTIVNTYAGRGGFISYRETGDFASDLGDCLIQIENSADAVIALDLAFILLEEAMEAFQYADDSDGDIGGLVEDTLEVVNVMMIDAIESGFDRRQVLFEKLLKQCTHPMFEDWDDYRHTLLNICTYFVDNKENREALIRKIESLIVEEAPHLSHHYHNEMMNRMLLEITEEYGTEEEADYFIQANLHYSSFREQLIKRYIVLEKYEQVIQLASDGEQEDKEYRGLVSGWMKYRYRAYKALSLHEEQQVLAKELFMAGDFDFYQELKGLAEDPKHYYLQLKQELQLKDDWQTRDLFQRLIEEEQDVVELMAFVQKNPRYIERYASDLVNFYKEDIEKKYSKYIKGVAARASSRPAYQEVCGMIRRYEKIAGKQHQQSIVEELRSSYRRKPAFMDELSKI